MYYKKKRIKNKLMRVLICLETFITGLDFFISKKYTHGMYKSCSHVSVPSTGQLALDIMCGSWGSMKCTPER